MGLKPIAIFFVMIIAIFIMSNNQSNQIHGYFSGYFYLPIIIFAMGGWHAWVFMGILEILISATLPIQRLTFL
jgi:uncharacterized integral membrane protein